MPASFVFVMVQAAMLQVVVFALRIATSYQAIEFGPSTLEIGVISASFALLPLILAVPIGRIIDRKGPFLAIFLAMACLALAVIGFNLLTNTVLGLVVSTVILGAGHFLSLVSQHAYVAALEEGMNRDRQFGWYAAAISLGQMLGPLVVALAGGDATPNLDLVYLICLPLAALQMLMVLPLAWSSRGAVRNHQRGQRRTIIELLRIKGVPVAILAGVAVMAGMDLLIVYLPVLGIERNVDASVVSLLLSVRAGFTLLSRLSYGYLAQRVPRHILLAGTIGSAGVACLTFVIPLPVPWVVMAVAAIGFGLGAALPITLSFLANIAPSDSRATLFSIRQSVMRGSQVVLPLASGGMAAVFGVGGLFLVLAVFLGSAAYAALKITVDS